VTDLEKKGVGKCIIVETSMVAGFMITDMKAIVPVMNTGLTRIRDMSYWTVSSPLKHGGKIIILANVPYTVVIV
jgi:hypothetical protein